MKNFVGEIFFAERYLPIILSGAKTTTVRNGIREYKPGVYKAYTPDKSKHITIHINRTEVTTFGKISDETAKTDGYTNADELKDDLLKFYPQLTQDSPVTIVYFEAQEESE